MKQTLINDDCVGFTTLPESYSDLPPLRDIYGKLVPNVNKLGRPLSPGAEGYIPPENLPNPQQ